MLTCLSSGLDCVPEPPRIGTWALFAEWPEEKAGRAEEPLPGFLIPAPSSTQCPLSPRLLSPRLS